MTPYRDTVPLQVRSSFPAAHSRCSDRRSLLSLVSIESDEPSGKTKRGSLASVTSVASEPRPHRLARASTSSVGSEDALEDQVVSLDEFRHAMAAVKPEVRHRRDATPRGGCRRCRHRAVTVGFVTAAVIVAVRDGRGL